MKTTITTRRRKLCLAWILAHRPRRYWLARLDDTPQAIASRLLTYAGQLAVIALLSIPVGAAFALAF